MDNLKCSDLKFNSDLDGLIWKRRSYCFLNKWHDLDYMYKQGHPYNQKLPEIIELKFGNRKQIETNVRKQYEQKLKSTSSQEEKDKIEVEIHEKINQEYMKNVLKYNEIMYDVFDPNFHKLPKYDIHVPSVEVNKLIPDFGISVVELDMFTPVGQNKLSYGLFIYDIDTSSESYSAGLRIGDTIVGITRTRVENHNPNLWKKYGYSHLDYSDDFENYRLTHVHTINDMFNLFNKFIKNEQIILHVYREDELVEVKMRVPFRKMKVKILENPRIVVKRVPDMRIVKRDLYMFYTSTDDYLFRSFEDLTCEIQFKEFDDEGNETTKNVIDGQLVMDIPDTVVDVSFEIDNEGNLVLRYE